jgi:hypothetical protein
MDSISSYATQKGQYTVNINSKVDKSWSGNNVNFDEIYELVKADDPIAADLMMAMKTYGLRPKEALCMRPHEADGGDHLDVLRGSKTGRKRSINFKDFKEEDLFRMRLDGFKDKVEPGNHMAWSKLTLKQAKERLNTISKKYGIRKNGKYGVTWYGLRHDFAIEGFEKLTGKEPPVRGGVGLNYRELSDARLTLTRAMGHNRKRVLGAYCGSFVSLEGEQLRNFKINWERIQRTMNVEVSGLLKDAGIDNLYLIPSVAISSRAGNFQYEFVLPPAVEPSIAVSVCASIVDFVMAATGYNATAIPWESLGEKQNILLKDAIPLFRHTSPVEYMKDRLQEDRRARMVDIKRVFEEFDAEEAQKQAEGDVVLVGLVMSNDAVPDGTSRLHETTHLVQQTLNGIPEAPRRKRTRPKSASKKAE